MLKTIARRMVSKDRWEFLQWYKSRFGTLPAIRAYIGLLFSQGIARVPDGSGGDVFLRPGTADLDVYDQVFIAKHYDVDLGDPRFMVDAGAHIGLSAVYFARRYPRATIVAIEPEPSNFAILRMNTRGHPNVRPIQAGLWSRKAHLRIDDPTVASWSFRVSESASGDGIPAIGVADVIETFEVAGIDVLKIDIEGAEVEVLGHNNAWMDEVRTLIIELHDRFRPGCTEALDQALSGRDYRKSMCGENVIITGIGRIAA